MTTRFFQLLAFVLAVGVVTLSGCKSNDVGGFVPDPNPDPRETGRITDPNPE